MGLFSETECRHCGSKDHASDNCPHNHGLLGIGGETKCRHCGSTDHSSDNCPHNHGLIGIGGETKCRHCGSMDHSSDNCPHNHGLLGIGGETKCRHCGSTDHSSDNCPHNHGLLGIGGETKCRYCESKNHASDNCPHRGSSSSIPPRPSDTQYSSNYDNSGSEDGLVKLVVGIAVIAFVIWFITSVAIPLVVINIATICLIGSFVKKGWSKVLLPVSVLGGVIVVADYNSGWATHVLVSNVELFRSWIKPLVYLNLISGLMAAYFMLRDTLNSKNPLSEESSEYSKRRLVTIGWLLAVGVATIGVQQYIDLNARHSDIAPPTHSVAPENSQIFGSKGPGSNNSLNSTIQNPSYGNSLPAGSYCTHPVQCAHGLTCENSACVRY